MSIHFMLESLKWLNIEQRLKFNTLHFIHTIKNDGALEYINEQVAYMRDSNLPP